MDAGPEQPAQPPGEGMLSPEPQTEPTSPEPPEAIPATADDPAAVLPSRESEEPAEKAEGIDWLSLALVLVILVNLALYYYSRSPGEPEAPAQVAAQGAPPAPAGSPPAAGGERPEPPGQASTAPADTGPKSAPPSKSTQTGAAPAPAQPASSQTDLDPFLNTEDGANALLTMHEQGGRLAFTADQKKRIKAYLARQRALASLGSQVASIESLLTPAQAALLKTEREEFSGGQPPRSQDPVAQAIAALKARAEDAKPVESEVDVPERGPTLDPTSLALGLLHLERKGDPERLTSAQAAAVTILLTEIQTITREQTGEKLERILTAPQRIFLQEKVQALGEASSGPPASSSSQARIKLNEALSR